MRRTRVQTPPARRAVRLGPPEPSL